MNSKIKTIIVGTGSYIPTNQISNSAFLDNKFYDADGNLFPQKNEEIIQKFVDITGIKSRRYASINHVASDLGFFAAQDALESSGIDSESLDYIIVAHNFGDVKYDNKKSDFVPSLAARIKHKLGIKNPQCIAQDLPFGCPGWLQGVIMANYLIRSGDAKRVLVIGTETLSRVCDPHDRDSMIYADGAGAVILEAFETEQKIGILSQAVRSDTIEHSGLLWMGRSYNPEYLGNELFLKMNGNTLYKYALRYVPELVKETLDKAGLQLSDVSKLLIHQANEKMDNAILEGLCRLYGTKEIPWHIMPMTIHEFGNSSVATVPTLFDLISKRQLQEHQFNSGDILVFASVGAGMNINAMVYKIP